MESVAIDKTEVCACLDNECCPDLAPGFECRKQLCQIEHAARSVCWKLLTSVVAAIRAGQFTPTMGDAVVLIAFTYGAAWALDLPEMIDLGDAQLDAIVNTRQ